MPRKARIDAPGALYHIIVRGIARKKVFDDDADRDFFVEQLLTGYAMNYNRRHNRCGCLFQNRYKSIYVTRLFDTHLSTARSKYRTFVQNGISDGRRDELVGGDRCVCGRHRSKRCWTTPTALLINGVFRLWKAADILPRIGSIRDGR